MGFKTLIAVRNILGKKEEKILFVIGCISIASITIGVCSLVVVLSVMDGFGYELRKRIVGVQPHIRITSIDGKIKNYEEIISKIDDPLIVSVYPYIEQQAIFKGKKSYGGIIYGMDKIDGIKLKEGSLADESSILLGRELSFILGSFPSSRIFIITASHLTGNPIISELVISGVFSSGMYDYDSSCAYIPLSSAKKMFKLDGVSGIGIKVFNVYKVNLVKERLYNMVSPYNLTVRTWEELNENLMSALKLERDIMALLLVCFLIISLFGISSLLVITIIKKKREIGILRLLGASCFSIVSIFLIEGGIIGVIGTLLGVVFGLFIGWFISLSVKLPGDIYYISSIPVHFGLRNIVLILLIAPFLSIVFSIWPSIWASSISLKDALRED
ncbi:TPA: hypothetical protein DCX16_03210 [bacterium]|nr:hypothetical protein [bacterium]